MFRPWSIAKVSLTICSFWSTLRAVNWFGPPTIDLWSLRRLWITQWPLVGWPKETVLSNLIYIWIKKIFDFLDNLSGSRTRQFGTFDHDVAGCASRIQAGWWLDQACNGVGDLNAPLRNVQWPGANHAATIRTSQMMIRALPSTTHSKFQKIWSVFFIWNF